MKTLQAVVILLGMATFAAGAASQERSYSYSDWEKNDACRQCHVDFYYQYRQAMMSKAYTHSWDEIEYFKLALPHARMDEKVAEVEAGCNGCHSPMAFLSGDIPPKPPSENTRANESVNCDFCHTITGFKGDIPFNFNYISEPGKTKYGPRPGVKSPHHNTEMSEFIKSAEFCGTCHNEKSPYGAWVKATHLEWKEGPYSKQGVVCQDCHMPKAPGVNAKMGETYPDVRQHLFHGAHDEGKLRGVIEMRMHANEAEVEPGETVVVTVVLHNAKAGHKVPTGSAEERILWLHVEAVDASGKRYHLPVDRKGFNGEEYTIASNVLAYQDMGPVLGIKDFKGIRREMVPEGDRIFRLPYLDPQGRMTIMQWNTKSFGPDYRIGPRETKIETFTWQIPDDIPPGPVRVEATLNYRRLVKPVADFLGVPEEESKIILINTAFTTFEIVDY